MSAPVSALTAKDSEHSTIPAYVVQSGRATATQVSLAAAICD